MSDEYQPPPDISGYSELEVFIAGAISTVPPMDTRHPQESLPLARRALEAAARWEPTDG